MSKELPGVSPMSLKMDMIHLQDEILRDMRQMQSKLDVKYAKSEESLKEKITKFDLKINNLEKKISELSNLIINDNSMKEKVESIFQFREEIQDTIFKRRAKFAEFEKKVNGDIDEINKIISNTVLYPAMIGNTAKFKTFHEFIDFCNQEISQLNIFKNKSGMDLTPFKKKVDGALEAFKIQINNFTPKEVTNQMVNDLAEKMESNFKLYDDRLQDARVENSHYATGIKKKSEDLEKQVENLLNAQKFLNKKIEKAQNMELYNILSNEVILVNNKINKIFDILKELVSYHPDVKRNFFELEKKSTKKIISGVRQYIKGNLNADELTTMKKFAFEKSNSKAFDKTSPAPKSTQNITSESSFKKFPFQKRQTIFLDSKPMKIGEEQVEFVNKKFMSKKTVNLNLTTNKANPKLVEPEKFIRGNLFRKNTVSVLKSPNIESSKVDNSDKKTNFKFDVVKEEKNDNIIEEENYLINYSNSSTPIINENKKSSENENSKNNVKINAIKDIKHSSFINGNEKIDKSPKKEKNVEFKNIISIEKDKTETSKNDKNDKDNSEVLNKKAENDSINIIKVKSKEDEDKKISLTKKNKGQNTDIKIKDNMPEKEIKEISNIKLENQELKNNHTRNNKTNLSKNNTYKSNVSFEPKTNKNNNTNNFPILSKLNLPKDPKGKESTISLSEDNRNPLSDEKKILIPINYNFKSMNPNINIVSIKKKMYKTFYNAPKINQDLAEKRIQLINPNTSFPKAKENYIKSKSENKYYNNEYKGNSANFHKKKILLMNPDDLPLNYFDKAYKGIIKNSLNENQNNKKNNEVKEKK